MEKIGVNDLVEWTSGASGIIKRKVGYVVEVIPVCVRPSQRPGLHDSKMGQPRNHESYIVTVGSLNYWPKVELLNVIKSAQTTSKLAKDKPKASPKKPEKSFLNDITSKPNLVNFIGFALDMSGSMRGMTKAATGDFNRNLETIKTAAEDTKQETHVAVSHFGVHSYQPFRNASPKYDSEVKLALETTPSRELRPMNEHQYLSHGYTPLRDGVMILIDELEKQKYSKSDNVSYLIMVITDGEENSSKTSPKEFSSRIKILQDSGNWSFVFRVPKGYKRKFASQSGIPEDNIFEWETNSDGLDYSSKITGAATSTYFTARSAGATQTRSFYANMSADDATIKKTLTDLTPLVRILPVVRDIDIKAFTEYHGETYRKGYGYYQLTKSEDVQDYKEIIVQDKVDGKIYGGTESRDLLGIPHYGSIKLKPGNTGHYDVFIQSTSVNRKLIAGTRMIYRSV